MVLIERILTNLFPSCFESPFLVDCLTFGRRSYLEVQYFDLCTFSRRKMLPRATHPSCSVLKPSRTWTSMHCCSLRRGSAINVHCEFDIITGERKITNKQNEEIIARQTTYRCHFY